MITASAARSPSIGVENGEQGRFLEAKQFGSRIVKMAGWQAPEAPPAGVGELLSSPLEPTGQAQRPAVAAEAVCADQEMLGRMAVGQFLCNSTHHEAVLMLP
jgi:hypothetical protein